MLNTINELKLTLRVNNAIKKRVDDDTCYFVSHHMSKELNPIRPGPILGIADYTYDGLKQEMGKMK